MKRMTMRHPGDQMRAVDQEHRHMQLHRQILAECEAEHPVAVIRQPVPSARSLDLAESVLFESAARVWREIHDALQPSPTRQSR